MFIVACKPRKKANTRPESVLSDTTVAVSEIFERNFINDSVYEKVNCVSDTNITYALFLPPGYDSTKRFPVIYFIDPHADGILPVIKYKSLAGKFQVILTGSNNSKNGNTVEANAAFISAVIADSKKRFAIDEKRVCAAGFSGGAKVASWLPRMDPTLRSVISCGAGIFSMSDTVQHFYYIGIAGIGDFNYSEMQMQRYFFQRSRFKNELIAFDGKHEWPFVEVMGKALAAIRLEEMRKQIIPVDTNFIKSAYHDFEKEVSTYKKSEHIIAEYEACLSAMNYLDRLAGVTPFLSRAKEIEESESYREAKAAQKILLERETGLRNQYLGYFSNKNEVWWSNEIKMMNKKIAASSTSADEKAMYGRIISYLGLAVYMYSDRSIKENDLLSAEHFLSIYSVIEPENPEAPFLSAKVAVRRGVAPKTFALLDEAIRLGFNDKKRLEEDDDFIALRNTEEFKRRVERIK